MKNRLFRKGNVTNNNWVSDRVVRYCVRLPRSTRFCMRLKCNNSLALLSIYRLYLHHGSSVNVEQQIKQHDRDFDYTKLNMQPPYLSHSQNPSTITKSSSINTTDHCSVRSDTKEMCWITIQISK